MLTFATVTLPDMGININDFLTACLQMIGDNLSTIAGCAICVLLVWTGLRFIRKGL